MQKDICSSKGLYYMYTYVFFFFYITNHSDYVGITLWRLERREEWELILHYSYNQSKFYRTEISAREHWVAIIAYSASIVR